MKLDPVFRGSTLVLALLVFACGGNVGRTIGPESEEPPRHGSAERVLLHWRSAIFPGPRDVGNRYRSIIKVVTREKIDGESSASLAVGVTQSGGECSGVLIDPRLVVTAGHCVCIARAFERLSNETPPALLAGRPRGSVLKRSDAIRGRKLAAVIDSSQCAKTSTVETIVYEPPSAGKGTSSHSQEYSGTVIPHPGLELLYNDEGDQVWATTDLAVIVLSEPVNDFPVFKLATKEVEANERIVMVGYGPGQTYGTFGNRHWGENTVGWLRPLESGSMEFVTNAQVLADGGPAAHALAGDSGGGCLSKADDQSLVGILSSYAQNARGDELSVFTSIHPHVGWLEQQRKALGPEVPRAR